MRTAAVTLLAALAIAVSGPPEAARWAPAGASAAGTLARPTLSGPESTTASGSGFFTVHWTHSGADSTSQSYVDLLAEAADSALAVQCGQMGYLEPPSDQGGGGDDSYDIYVMAATGRGYCSYAGEPRDPATPSNDRASFIVLSSGLEQDIARVAIAHYFQNAVQMAYDVDEPVWFMENCATWMEDMVFDSVDDYWNYLHEGDNPLRKPWLDCMAAGPPGYCLGGCIWPRYISLRLGESAVREVWESCADAWGQNLSEALADVFGGHEMTLGRAFAEYGCWRWFTGPNWHDGETWDDEAAGWTPGPYVFPDHDVTSLPYAGDQGPHPPESWGIHWIRVDLRACQSGWLRFDFDGSDDVCWILGVILWDTSGSSELYLYEPSAPACTLGVSVDPDGWDYAVFFPGVAESGGPDHTYDFSVDQVLGSGEQPGPAQVSLSVTGNPCGSSASALFDLPQADSVRLVLFDLSGRMIGLLYDGWCDAGEHSLAIPVEGIAPGSYMLLLWSGSGGATARLTVTE
ncbi:hypothetical protein JW921_05320 [Candidatus Fermentibacterales bacterium]|nr:hypothetical protein [Candidatus Fermentibacterales bacterium]